MSSPSHQDVDGGVEHGGVKDLRDLSRQLLELAHDSSAHRASRTLITVGTLRSTLIALAAGGSLAEHENPGAATLHVVSGSVVLHTSEQQWTLPEGSLAQIPDERHGLRTEQDAVVLLTVALQATDSGPLVG